MSYQPIVEDLVRAVPGFAPQWTQFIVENQDEDALPLYIGLGELAHYLAESYAASSTAEFPELFAAVERHLDTDDRELIGLIEVGLFEVLQNVASHHPSGYRAFEQWLSPRSLGRWREVEANMSFVDEWLTLNPPDDQEPFDSEAALNGVKSPRLRKFILGEFRKRP